MDTLKEWATGLCYISCSCMIAYYILPSGKLSETAKKVISILCLSAMTVYVMSDGIKMPDFDYNSYEDSADFASAQIGEQLCEAAAVSVKAGAQITVEKNFSGEYKIFVTADIQPDNSILISELRVVLISGDGDAQTIQSALENETGLKAVVEDERAG